MTLATLHLYVSSCIFPLNLIVLVNLKPKQTTNQNELSFLIFVQLFQVVNAHRRTGPAGNGTTDPIPTPSSGRKRHNQDDPERLSINTESERRPIATEPERQSC